MKRFLLFFFLLSFSFACEAPYDDANPDVSILNRVWVDHYRDQDGVEIRHTLIFYQNGRGEEYIWDKRYSEDWEEYYTFYWSWEYNHTRIRLEYDDFELLFTNVYVTSGSLSGLFDGVSVNFTFNQVVSP
ncbi:MAG: hypothetical protein LUG98_12685 [Tannerellaceae bacterium]|nr:hypothetical protein [Tannerellaceae bacterium]